MKLRRTVAASVLVVSLPLTGIASAGQDQITSKDLPDQVTQTASSTDASATSNDLPASVRRTLDKYRGVPVTPEEIEKAEAAAKLAAPSNDDELDIAKASETTPVITATRVDTPAKASVNTEPAAVMSTPTAPASVPALTASVPAAAPQQSAPRTTPTPTNQTAPAAPRPTPAPQTAPAPPRAVPAPAPAPPTPPRPAVPTPAQVNQLTTPPRTAQGPATATPRPATPPVPTPAPSTQVVPVDPGDQPPGPLQDLGQIEVVVGSGLTLTWADLTVQRVAISDQNVANINVVSRRELVVNGLKTGRTSVFVWFANGRRIFYRLVVTPNLEPVRAALRDVNENIIAEMGADGNSLILRGEVGSENVARQARALAEQLVPRSATNAAESMRIVNLLHYGDAIGTAEDRLAAAMAAVDPRIKVRRIQKGVDPDTANDSYILEGRVKDVNSLVKAVVLADRQLGGTGKTVKAADADRVSFQRNSSGGFGGGFGAGGSNGAMQALQGSTPPQSGISAQLARGLLVTSESGKVVSFLEVDSLPQVLVAIRVLEINRSKARNLGVDLRFDAKNISGASSTILNGSSLTNAKAGTTNLPSGGNMVGSFVHDTLGISAALDMLSEKHAARSVAEPNILTLSGEQASVLVGGEVPIPATISNQVSVASGFDFQGFGVRLDIRPTTDEHGVVTLEVAPSIVTPSATLGNNSVPGFQIQRVETTARVPAGQSLVLGGLLTSSDSIQSRGVPGLQKLPLFRWQRNTTDNTELVFLITPRIIEPPSDPASLPPVEFRQAPNHLGQSGLDTDGVPFTFKGQGGSVLGKSGFCLELRDQPTDDAATLSDCLLPGTEVVILDRKDDYLQIHAPGGQEGWVLRRWIHISVEKR